MVLQGYQTQYFWVYIAIFAWGCGCFFTNSAIMVIALKYLDGGCCPCIR